ncbi:EAL domain-containing protein [Arenimonas malthae]|uniref:EAL domain-containing protein n=1 Tax=Arenimonas malthae TaxID=354197 RepID=UPI000694CE56|nr:EAL domain-containing protein [Arenimonas malthae]
MTVQSPPPAATSQAILDAVTAPGGLFPVYQPVVRLEDMSVRAHEGLVRCACEPSLPPPAIFDAARQLGRLPEIELLAARTVVAGYGFAEGHGRLFVNLSATALMDPTLRLSHLRDIVRAAGVDASRLIIELSERDVVEDMAVLAEPIRGLRAAGAQLALDDFGSGHSNFSLWQALGPEYVKLDRSIVHGVSRSSRQLAIIRALMQVAEEFRTDLIAEGIEDDADLALVRDLGIRCGQGYSLGRPVRQPVAAVPEARARMQAWPVPVRPTTSPAILAREVLVSNLLIEAPAVGLATSNHQVGAVFKRHEGLHALAVLDEGRPVGLINRRVFMERLGQPFAREIFGAKSCVEFMHAQPVVCDADTPVAALLDVLRGEDQRYLADGFVITRDGSYAGLGTGESLVRRVSEIRIEAARYANPLTLLPGNIPITVHLQRLLKGPSGFVVAYADLNHFKPFNDQYGYFRGDAMIELLANTMRAQVDARIDFLGHVGGDDFVVMFQSPDWRERCRAIIAGFNEAARRLFDPADLERGGIEAEDRAGHPGFFPITTLAVGAVVVSPGLSATPEQVATAAAQAKRRAKQDDQPFFETTLAS